MARLMTVEAPQHELDLSWEAAWEAASQPRRRAVSGGRAPKGLLMSAWGILDLHGMGPTAIAALRGALHERGLWFGECSSRSSDLDCGVVSAEEVDEYLRGVEEPKRAVLQTLRRAILEVVPEAEQVISYGVPAFRVRGKTVAGFAAFKTHLSYLPFSGSVLGQLGDELDDYTMTTSSLHFPLDRPLPKVLVKKLIAARLADASRRSR